jgi:hypothetical protein
MKRGFQTDCFGQGGRRSFNAELAIFQVRPVDGVRGV